MMVVVVGDVEGILVVVVVDDTGMEVMFVAMSTTLLAISSTKVASPVEMFLAGLAVTATSWSLTEGMTATVVTGAVVLSATSSKILEGRNPAASISGSHFTLIGAITKI